MSDENVTVEQRAVEMGWAPKEEFRGDPDKWIDAESYVRRGEEVLPIVQANNRKLMTKVEGLTSELTEAKALLRAATESIEALKEFNSTQTRAAAKEKKGEIITAIAEARREGDVETEIELTEQLTETNAALKEAEKKPDTKPNGNGTANPIDPALKEWMVENPWFGVTTDPASKRKSAIALAIAQDIRTTPGILYFA
jgi:hypothetical protein